MATSSALAGEAAYARPVIEPTNATIPTASRDVLFIRFLPV
jgi:hypothetical protein